MVTEKVRLSLDLLLVVADSHGLTADEVSDLILDDGSRRLVSESLASVFIFDEVLFLAS